MNTMSLREITHGKYGREVAYVSAEKVTRENVLDIIHKTYAVFVRNKRIADYLWNYKKGDQPIHYRTKTIRDDVNNPIVENHAWEIVRFKNGQTNGEPIQAVAAKKEDKINEYVEKFNQYCNASGKHAKDVSSGEWTSAVGTGYKAVQRTKKDIPFRIVVPTPLNTYIVYSSVTEEPLLSVQTMKDENDKTFLHCFSETTEYVIEDDVVKTDRLHAFGGIPIVEYPNNQDRVSDIELVIDILDAINNMQSNRMDSIEQFVQSWIKFVNCDIDEETFQKMKMNGALVVKSNNGAENKADVDIMTQELNQTESQVAKDDLWDNALGILAIPKIGDGSGQGDRTGAVELKNGWDFSKQSVRIKDAYTKQAEKRLYKVILNVIRQSINETECPLGEMDYEVQISHSPQDNMLIKAEVLQMLINCGINPSIAIETCGLWSDSEKVYAASKDVVDNISKQKIVTT